MGMRGRFTLWFTVAALVPIAAAAVITQVVLSDNYRSQYERDNASSNAEIQQALARLTMDVDAQLAGLVRLDNELVGGLLVDMQKSAGLSGDGRRRARQLAGPMMRSLGLDVLVLATAEEVVAAPHHRGTEGRRGTASRAVSSHSSGKPYFAVEAVLDGDTIEQVLVAEAVRSVSEGGHEVWVVAGKRVPADVVDGVRVAGRVTARIVGMDGHQIIGDAPMSGAGDERRFALAGFDGQPVAWVVLKVFDTELEGLLGELRTASLVLAGAALLISVLLGFIAARRMTSDLGELVHAAEVVSSGDLDCEVSVQSSGEIRTLATAFNTMVVELKDSKGRLARAERIAAWQEIARRLAHEIKNPLTPIQMSIETLRKVYKKHHPSFGEVFEESTTAVLQETERLKRIVSEFSEFARLPKPTIQMLSVTELVRSATTLYGGHVEVETQSGLPEIEADRDQLTQVVLNLVENARDAAGEGGRVRVRVSRSERGGFSWVRIEVADSGPGLTDELRDVIFTPYFTTKLGRGGTGLGLAVVHRIVSDHGGRIDVGRSEDLGGAEFAVLLVVSRAKRAAT